MELRCSIGRIPRGSGETLFLLEATKYLDAKVLDKFVI